MNATQYWIHKNVGIDKNEIVQLNMDNYGHLSIMIASSDFKSWIRQLKEFDGDYQYVELVGGQLKISIEVDKSISPNEANINFFIKLNAGCACTTFRCYVSDIYNMATYLAAEMNRTDGKYNVFSFKFKHES